MVNSKIQDFFLSLGPQEDVVTFNLRLKSLQVKLIFVHSQISMKGGLTGGRMNGKARES